MQTTNSFKSDEIHLRILKMLYAAGYSEICGSDEWREYAFNEFNKLAKVGDFLPRTFNSGGRLFLCFAFSWLVNEDIVNESERLAVMMNRLFYRDEIIWDCSPDMITAIDTDIDGDGVVMSILFNETDTLERYALQERAIAHLNKLERLLSGGSKFVDLNNIHPLLLCSMLNFVMMCHNKRIYPFRTAKLLSRIRDIWAQSDHDNRRGVLFEYLNRKNTASDNLADNLYQLSGADDEVAMFLFLHGMSEIYRGRLPESLPSPDAMNMKRGTWCCCMEQMLNVKRNGTYGRVD